MRIGARNLTVSWEAKPENQSLRTSRVSGDYPQAEVLGERIEIPIAVQ